MSNKFNGFTVPSNMNPPVEQRNTERLIAEQSALNAEGLEGLEGEVNPQKVEIEPTETVPESKQATTQGPTPQSYSAMQRDFVEDKGGIGAISKTEWGSELDIKAGCKYSVDITTVSNN